MATNDKNNAISPMAWIEYIGGGDLNEMFAQKKTDYGEECSGCMHQGDGLYCNECIRSSSRSTYDYYTKDSQD